MNADAEIRELIADLLLDEDLELRDAANVDDALLELRRGVFDVVLCDLPLLRARHGLLGRSARELHPDAWIVAMSASDGPRDGEADVSLAKPFARVQLLEALRVASATAR